MAIQTQEYSRIGDDSGFAVALFRYNDATMKATRVAGVNGMSRVVEAIAYDSLLPLGELNPVRVQIPPGGEVEFNIGGLNYSVEVSGGLLQLPDHVSLGFRTI